MSRVGAAICAVLVGGLLTACGSSGPAVAADAYLHDWAHGDLAAAATRTDNPTLATQSLQRLRTDLHVAAIHVTRGQVKTHGAAATARFDATLDLPGVGAWRYPGVLQLVRNGSHWTVHWTPQDVHPQLAAGTHLDLVRTLPARAPLLDDTGTPMFTEQPVVDIGLEPARMHGHSAETVATVARVLGVDGAALAKAVAAAGPDAFVPVITLRQAAYEAVKPRIYSLPGTVFRTRTALLTPRTGFARALLGSVGPATADVLKAAHGAYVAGDVLGLSGLQEVFQQRLTGRASTSVVVRDANGATVTTLRTWPGAPGSAVRTTLDIATQEAAEAALAHESKPAALVAVRTTDGAVLAAANTPDTTSFDRAIVGRYPPGSTFKILTTYALLSSGLTPATTIPCPATITVDGKQFRNFEGESAGAPTFAHDFAVSCNTAFIAASRRLDDGALTAAADAFGVGTPWHLPLDGFSGSVPAPAGPVEKAADAIGQGRVEMSPLAMALVAAAVASGHSSSPRLVTDPAPAAAAPPHSPRADVLTTLRSLMHLVVTSGTAAGAHLPAGTFGKTGTAEFGTGNPPRTHAWFVGYRGDIAFAVLVEGGGVGGEVAAPIAADFLSRLSAA